MIDAILPADVAVAELLTDPPGMPAHPAEAPLIARAVDKRRREFISARHCARTALGKLGVAPAPILKGPKGEPLWPAGIAGTLTHCEGYRGAAVARTPEIRSLGIDSEPHEPLPDGVLEHVSLPEERAWLASADAPGLHLDKVLFCSKEATYKAWFPLASRWLGFEDAHIAFEIDARPLSFADGRQAVASGSFHTKLLVDGSTLSGSPLTTFDGRWLIADGLVLTAIAHR